MTGVGLARAAHVILTELETRHEHRPQRSPLRQLGEGLSRSEESAGNYLRQGRQGQSWIREGLIGCHRRDPHLKARYRNLRRRLRDKTAIAVADLILAFA